LLFLATSVGNNCVLSFSVGVTSIEVLSFLVDEGAVLVTESLEPTAVSSPDLHVTRTPSILNIPGVASFANRLDCLSLMVEDPLLSLVTISSLSNQVGVVDDIKEPATSCRDNVEWLHCPQSKLVVTLDVGYWLLAWFWLSLVWNYLELKIAALMMSEFPLSSGSCFKINPSLGLELI
jgi:hypothetical protein